MARSYYQNTISDFLREDVNAVLGSLQKIINMTLRNNRKMLGKCKLNFCNHV